MKVYTRIKVEFHFDQVVNETDLINNLATLKGMAIVAGYHTATEGSVCR